MPWLRHKRWRYATALTPVVTVCASRRVYRCTGADGGVVDVSYRADADEMLSPTGDEETVWEVAWERYGVQFDAQGKAVESTPIPCESAVPLVASPAPLVTGKPRRGRPRKRSR